MFFFVVLSFLSSFVFFFVLPVGLVFPSCTFPVLLVVVVLCFSSLSPWTCPSLFFVFVVAHLVLHYSCSSLFLHLRLVFVLLCSFFHPHLLVFVLLKGFCSSCASIFTFFVFIFVLYYPHLLLFVLFLILHVLCFSSYFLNLFFYVVVWLVLHVFFHLGLLLCSSLFFVVVGGFFYFCFYFKKCIFASQKNESVFSCEFWVYS